MFRLTFLGLGFAFILSTGAVAGDSNCKLKVADAVALVLSQDTDTNGTVSLKESLGAYAFFDAEIYARSKMEPILFRKGIYTYVLNHEKYPAELSSITAWLVKKPSWNYEKNESQIARAMNAFYQCD